MKSGSRIVCVSVLAALSLSLGGCDSLRRAAGLEKQAPDEFAVVTKAPLIIPPDYNLRPPEPGAAPTNQVSPTSAAQAALFSDDPNAVANSLGNGYSDEERQILAASGGAVADHSIRQQLASDQKALEGADSSFTDSLLFGGSNPDAGHPVNADEERQRIDAAKAAGQAQPGGAATTANAPGQSNGQATISKEKSNDGGWLGGIF